MTYHTPLHVWMNMLTDTHNIVIIATHLVKGTTRNFFHGFMGTVFDFKEGQSPDFLAVVQPNKKNRVRSVSQTPTPADTPLCGHCSIEHDDVTVFGVEADRLFLTNYENTNLIWRCRDVRAVRAQ